MKHLLMTSLLLLSAQMSFAKAEIQNIPVQITENGFEPSEIKAKAGSHVVLKVTRKTDATCATQIVVKEKNIKSDLPLNKEVSVDLGTLKKGDVKFACGMNMISGHVVIDQ